jgi:hypothetical protein
MAYVFQRRLAIPLWFIAVFTVVLTAQPTATLFLMPPATVVALAAVGMAAIVFLMPGAMPWLRTSRASVRVLPSGRRDPASAAITLARGSGVGTLDTTRPLVIGLCLILGGQLAFAQEMSRYRAYVLESSLDSIVAVSGARATDAHTLHERPATIQELEWRAPYVDSRDTQADPVREIRFTFYNDALYQVVVHYDRARTEGLTNGDLIEALSTAYGAPMLPSARAPAHAPVEEEFPGSIVVARWENADSWLTLIRGSYSPECQLILESKSLSARARTAVREAVRLDAVEAPRRAAAQRQKEADDASAARDKARTANKAAFRP